MTNTNMLSNKVKESGLKLTFIAKKLGITREGLYRKMRNETEFKASEIICLQTILRLTNKERDEIFFATKVE